MESCVIQTKVPARVKSSVDKVFHRFGITTNDGIRMFLNQVMIDGALPFRPNLNPSFNAKTAKVIDDAHKGKNTKTFASLDELYQDLGI